MAVNAVHASESLECWAYNDLCSWDNMPPNSHPISSALVVNPSLCLSIWPQSWRLEIPTRTEGTGWESGTNCPMKPIFKPEWQSYLFTVPTLSL